MPKDKLKDAAGRKGAAAGQPEDRPGDAPEDLEDLARRYVDLWQDQMTALAADPGFAESLQKVMGAMGVAASGLPAMWSAWPAAMTSLMAAAQPCAPSHRGANLDGQETHEQPAGGKQNGGGESAAAGSKAAAAASDGGGTDLGVLQERLAALEQRVRSLEGPPGKGSPGKGAPGRARGRAKGKTQRD